MNELIAQFQYTLAKFEQIAKRMDEREEALDATMLDLPFPDGVAPPSLPEGKTRWIYRGKFLPDEFYPCKSRYVRYSINGIGWRQAYNFSTHAHHIEAV